MIYQVAHVKDKTAPLPKLNKGLIQARHIQARLKSEASQELPEQVEIWSSITAGPYTVPVMRWID
jgi:hypothetical protein